LTRRPSRRLTRRDDAGAMPTSRCYSGAMTRWQR
jgi:hypothetical protein